MTSSLYTYYTFFRQSDPRSRFRRHTYRHSGYNVRFYTWSSSRGNQQLHWQCNYTTVIEQWEHHTNGQNIIHSDTIATSVEQKEHQTKAYMIRTTSLINFIREIPAIIVAITSFLKMYAFLVCAFKPRTCKTYIIFFLY